MMNKKNLPTKICKVCKKISLGEKNGNHVGIKFYIALRDVEEIKINE
tara:strand:+ start:2520 stop:2660 length:141 start_codon:yes stop_codon:yes gene_type:complete